MRRLTDRLFLIVTGICAALTLLVLVGIVATILVRGLPAIDWRLLTAGEGGVLYQLVGTLILVLTALAASAPVAVALALAVTVYRRGGRAAGGLRTWLFALNGVPSIVFGVLGLMVFVRAFGWGKSWLGGGLVLGLMVLPTLTVALIERIDALPASYVAAARALGLGRDQTVRAVVLRQSAGGLVSGALLGLARAAGETAPILFTAAIFSGATVPGGVRDSPVLALPYHIFVLAQDTLDRDAASQLWAAAFVLLLAVFGLSLAALPLRLRFSEEAVHG